MACELPAALRVAIAGLIEARGLAGLSTGQARMSDDYRAGKASSVALRSEPAIAGYLAARLPATYAAVRSALGRLQGQRPDITPRTLLDVGCGPGTASFAALDAYPGIEALTGVDHNPALLATARRLFETSGLAGSRRLTLTTGDVTRDIAPVPTADLVILSYALVESDLARAGAIATRLWACTADVLVLVEPGSPAGFQRLLAARTALMAAGATILAPCTHAHACPMVAPDWCHTSVRLARSREHLRAKAAAVPFEDEKFAYLIAARTAGAPQTGSRIVAPPHHGKPGVTFRLCSAKGLETCTIAARDPAFKAARKLEWGDWMPPDGTFDQ